MSCLKLLPSCRVPLSAANCKASTVSSLKERNLTENKRKIKKLLLAIGMDIDENFSCADPGVDRVNVTERLWMIQSEGRLHESSITAIAALQLVYVLVGVPWNFIVAITIVIKRLLIREPTYILLLSLVISDLLVCGFAFPLNIYSGFNQAFTLGNSDYSRCQLCQAIVVVIITLIYVSIFSLALMSSDRLFYIKWPFTYKKHMTATKVIVVVIAVWILSFLISLPPIFSFGEIKFANSVGSCSVITTGSNRLTANIYYIFFLALIGTVPFVLTVVVNIWLLVIACKSIGQLYEQNRHQSTAFDGSEINRGVDTEYHKKQIRLAKVFGVIFAVNTTIWITTSFIVIIAIAIDPDNVPAPVFATVFVIFLSQPAIHPMLETCLVGKAKTTIVKYLCFFCRNKIKQRSNITSLHTMHQSNESVLN